jgi:hypothetical protein
MIPEEAIGSRISGLPDMTVTIHRKFSFNLLTNALGVANVIWQPASLVDTATLSSTLWSVAASNATYDGVSVAGSTAPVNIVHNQQITPLAVLGYRLVSASMHVVPQSSVLNQAGTIHAALIKAPVAPLGTYGGTCPANVATLEFYPNFQDNVYYGAASISNQEAARILWVPHDSCYTEFTNINNSYAVADSVEQINTIAVVVVGAGASQSLRVDLYQNFEVTVPQSSILQGMEDFSIESERPEMVWRTILLNHKHDIIKCSRYLSDTTILTRQFIEAQRTPITDDYRRSNVITTPRYMIS